MVVLHPDFGVSLEEIRNNLKGTIKITNNSSLIIKGNH